MTHSPRPISLGSSLETVMIAVAAGWIALHVAPSGPACQLVEVRLPHGQPRTYAVQLDDPLVLQLQADRHPGRIPRSTPGLRLAKWQREMAAHYRQQSKPADQPIAQVAYHPAAVEDQPTERDPGPGPGGVSAHGFDRADASIASEHAYWSTLESDAARRIRVAEAKLTQLRETAVAVNLGEITAPQQSALAWAGAALTAILAGTWLVWHRRRCPPVSVERLRFVSPTPACGGVMQIQIPAAWVRIRQPPAVLRRRIISAAILAGAPICHFIAVYR